MTHKLGFYLMRINKKIYPLTLIKSTQTVQFLTGNCTNVFPFALTQSIAVDKEMKRRKLCRLIE